MYSRFNYVDPLKTSIQERVSRLGPQTSYNGNLSICCFQNNQKREVHICGKFAGQLRKRDHIGKNSHQNLFSIYRLHSLISFSLTPTHPSSIFFSHSNRPFSYSCTRACLKLRLMWGDFSYYFVFIQVLLLYLLCYFILRLM